jgi:hypothetical protein
MMNQSNYLFNNLKGKIKNELKFFSITPVFPKMVTADKKNNNSIESYRYKILVVHPGYSVQRHYNDIEAILQLLKKKKPHQEFELYVLSCGGSVNACGFVSFHPGDIVSTANIAKSQCSRCQKFHSRRMPHGLYNHININEIAAELEANQINTLIDSLGSYISRKQLSEFIVADVRIGDLVIESIQRSLLETTRDEYVLEKGGVAYEYLRSGIIYALVSDQIFSRTKFDLVIGNEVSYIDWGVPARFSIKHGVTYLHQSHHYNYDNKQLLLVNENKTSEDLKRPPHVPVKDLFYDAISQVAVFREYKQRGRRYLEAFSGLPESFSIENKLEIEFGEGFDKTCKTIVIFTHLCWDSAQSFGDSLYDSFEAWLEDIFDIAMSRTDLNWIFKIHPAEVEGALSSRFNTATFLERLSLENKPKNIFVLKGSSDIKTVDLIPYISAGLTVLGTVCMELSIYGIPCLLSTRLGYAEFPFVHSVSNLSDYRDMVYRIDSLRPPTQEERDIALALFGTIFSNDSYINVENLFEKTDSSDRRVSTRRLNKWLSQTNLHFGVKPRLD